MHRHECNTHNFLFNLENHTKDFSYTIFPVKKNKGWKSFRIMRKLLFKYSLYSHPEIGNFRCDILLGGGWCGERPEEAATALAGTAGSALAPMRATSLYS
jgi:hypothetical protein